MQLPNTLQTPSFFQKLHWVADPIGYMESAAQKYPDLFTAEIIGFGDTAVFVQHPKALQEILTNDKKKFTALAQPNGFLEPIIGNSSVIMLEGERHKRRRQLLIPPFHGDRMKAYGNLICSLTEKIFSQLPQNQSFLARTVTQQISLEVILEAVFGLTEGERYQKLKHLLILITDLFQSSFTSASIYFSFLQKDLGAWSPWGNFVRLRQQIDQLLYAEIAERRLQNDSKRIDILSLLMSVKDEQGESMTDQQLRDEMMTLLLAGNETTASAMAWGLYWIHRLPEVREKMLQELNTLGDFPNPTSIVQLPYLTAVSNEILRISPVAMITFPRIVQEPTELLGHHLEPGTVMIGCIYLLHQREDLYPQHQQFQPERFLNRQFSPYEFMPFGGGVRRCVGDALAAFEMKLVLATIVSRYQLALVENRPEKLQRRGITLAPRYGVKMRFDDN
ncbi:MAG: cytochrome P450 [Komarekiella atlantica HA4396-MV6]|jgi:unspecific monooxygenase|nr:cytochrome P450 [Komarekiella atlantica HA4396-MV6]